MHLALAFCNFFCQERTLIRQDLAPQENEHDSVDFCLTGLLQKKIPVFFVQDQFQDFIVALSRIRNYTKASSKYHDIFTCSYATSQSVKRQLTFSKFGNFPKNDAK